MRLTRFHLVNVMDTTSMIGSIVSGRVRIVATLFNERANLTVALRLARVSPNVVRIERLLAVIRGWRMAMVRA